MVSEAVRTKADFALQRFPDATLAVRLSREWTLGRQLPYGGEPG